MSKLWHIPKQSISGHIAWLDDTDWLQITHGWYLIWQPLEPYNGGVTRRPLPRNWCLIGLG